MPTITENAPEERAATETAEPKRPAKTSEKYNIPFDDSKIVKYGESGGEILRKVADEIKVVDSNIRTLIREMAELMYSAHGVGLAAPQVGKSIRLFVYDAGDGLRAMINPVILKEKGEQFEPEEGCLSIPGLRGVVRRARDITVRAQDENGRPVRFRATDFEARIIQHENDHLNGVLFIDIADPKTLHMLTPEEQKQEHDEIASGEAPVESDIPPAE
jgi:peptide deformylase